MPHSSQKQIILRQVEDLAIIETVGRLQHVASDTEDNQGDDSLQSILIAILQHGPATRYLAPRSNIPKIEGQLQMYMSHEYPEDRFKSLFRMGKRPFLQIASLIQDNEVFQSDSFHQQAPPATQLAVALFKMGLSDQSTVRSSTLLGIGDGTVHLYLWRVVKVLMKYHFRNVVRWPHETTEMKRVQDEIEEGTKGNFQRCCGFLDGSYIDLAEEPAIDGASYWTRKKSYSFNVQAICDFRLRFTYVMLGPVGSIHDSRAFKSSDIYRRPGIYFP